MRSSSQSKNARNDRFTLFNFKNDDNYLRYCGRDLGDYKTKRKSWFFKLRCGTKKNFNARLKAIKVRRAHHYTEVLVRLIRGRLIPLLDDIFKGYEDGEVFGPTFHLSKALAGGELLPVVTPGFVPVYELGRLGTNFRVSLAAGDAVFQITIDPLENEERDHTRTNFSDPLENEERDHTRTNFSFSRHPGMYIYGIKANGPGPRLRGTVLNALAFEICRAMHIPKLYISDSAGIGCHWDDKIEIAHFSILRIAVGKKGFYEQLPGTFKDPEKAAAEKDLIQATVTQEEKDYINKYLDAVTRNLPAEEGDDCRRINEIVEKCMKVLKDKEVLKYIATPYVRQMGRALETQVAGNLSSHTFKTSKKYPA